MWISEYEIESEMRWDVSHYFPNNPSNYKSNMDGKFMVPRYYFHFITYELGIKLGKII